MAGHSQFKNIMHRKGAQDAKRAKLFTKIIRELTVSAREGGPDPSSNPRLKAAIGNAKEANMPKDTMEKAIKRGEGQEEGSHYESVRYEGYGPEGSALIIECLTDNRNRTASEVRSTLGKHGGSLGETNSVGFMFNHKGIIQYDRKTATPEAMFDAALEAGAEDIDTTEDVYTIICPLENFGDVRASLQTLFQDPTRACLTWIPQTDLTISPDGSSTLAKLIDILEENDDVQIVYTNAFLP